MSVQRIVISMISASLGLVTTACPGSLDPELFPGPGADGGGGPADSGTDPCAYVVDTVLGNSSGCALGGCHAAANAQRGLDLASPDLFERLSGLESSAECPGYLLIDPDAPAESLLYTKVTADPPCGDQMPPFPTKLPEEDIACILTWITNTANRSSGEPDGGVDMDSGVDGESPLRIYFEAEAATSIRMPFTVRTDPAASGGEYVAQDGTDGIINADPDDPTVGLLTFEFTLSETGPTQFWARARGPTIDNNSFWVRIDDGAWIRYNDIPTGVADFVWDDIHDSDAADAPVELDLPAGPHTMEVAFREPNAQLDRILISQDIGFTPTSN